MMHVKAGIALLSDMVADLSRVCALCCRVLAATPSRRLSAIVCGTKKENGFLLNPGDRRRSICAFRDFDGFVNETEAP